MDSLPPSLLELNAYLVSKVGKDARRRTAIRLAGRDLRMWHVAVLAALRDFGPMIQRDLAQRLGLDPSDVVKVLDDLTRAGQVDRSRDPADRRRTTVTLTEAGHAAFAELHAEAVAAETPGAPDDPLAPLTAEERAQLHSLLLRVLLWQT